MTFVVFGWGNWFSCGTQTFDCGTSGAKSHRVQNGRVLLIIFKIELQLVGGSHRMTGINVDN